MQESGLLQSERAAQVEPKLPAPDCPLPPPLPPPAPVPASQAPLTQLSPLGQSDWR